MATNNPEFAARVTRFRTHGIERSTTEQSERGGWFYAMRDLGYNYRLSDVASALGWSQLRKLDRFIARRREIARVYSSALAGLGLELPTERTNAESAWHLYVVRVPDPSDRRDFFEALQVGGLGVQVHYIPVYWHPYYEQLGFRRGTCPIAEAFYARAISLPIFPAMTDADVETVVAIVTAIARKHISSPLSCSPS